MFRVIFHAIIVYFALSSLVFAAPRAQSMDEINSDLQAKKSALEPFDPKKVKVDVESLGLDSVDDKTDDKKNTDTKNDDVPPAPAEAAQAPIASSAPPSVAVKTPAQQAQEHLEQQSGVISKIKNIFKSDKEKAKEVLQKLAPQEEKKAAVTVKKSTKKYVNLKAKKDLKKRLAQEKSKADLKIQREKNAKKQKERLKKLQELRQTYLIKLDESERDQMMEEKAKIIPHKKDLNRFILEEAPAPPILNNYRTADNRYIPLIPTTQDNIDLLFETVISGRVPIFNNAYKRIENPEIKNQNGDTILTCATLLRKYAIMLAVLNEGANPNKPNDLGYNPLSIAIEMLDEKALEILVKNKADINYRDAFGRTYLMQAARIGFLPAISMLIDRGIDINTMDNDGFTALSIAYRHKQELAVQYLIKYGAKTWIEKPYDPGEQSLIKELENRWQN
jgi:hypothetical protein